jgi:hypothetical protein
VHYQGYAHQYQRTGDTAANWNSLRLEQAEPLDPDLTCMHLTDVLQQNANIHHLPFSGVEMPLLINLIEVLFRRRSRSCMMRREERLPQGEMALAEMIQCVAGIL